MNGAKVNSTCIGTSLLNCFVVGDSQNNIRLYTFESDEEIEVKNDLGRFTPIAPITTYRLK